MGGDWGLQELPVICCGLGQSGASDTSPQITTVPGQGTMAPRRRVLGEPPTGQRQDPHGALALGTLTAASSTTHTPAERAPRVQSCLRLSRNQGPPGEGPGTVGIPQTRAALPGGPPCFPQPQTGCSSTATNALRTGQPAHRGPVGVGCPTAAGEGPAHGKDPRVRAEIHDVTNVASAGHSRQNPGAAGEGKQVEMA